MGGRACRVRVTSNRQRTGRPVHDVVAVHDVHAENAGDEGEHQ
jgi:hypothetical protein